MIPKTAKNTLVRYVVDGLPPGDSMAAILRGDLLRAVCRADEETFINMREIVRYIYNHCPPNCHNLGGGNLGVVEDWIASFAPHDADCPICN